MPRAKNDCAIAGELALSHPEMEPSGEEILRLPGGAARVAWRRNRRARRVSLRIDPKGGAVVVTLPPRAGRQAGVALLMDHADWVVQRLAALPGAVAFVDGAAVELHGMVHVIRRAGGRGGVRVEGRTILVGGEEEFLGRRVGDFLRTEARRRFSALVAAQAARAGGQPRRGTVKDTGSRWGSCAPDRTLAFSWRLVMAPLHVQDYVAAHETAHLRHMNHGARFWALVDDLTPHREAAMVWLRREGSRLLRVG